MDLSTDDNIIGFYDWKDDVEVLSPVPWWKVEHNGQIGFISGRYFDGYRATGNVWLRDAPCNGAAIIVVPKNALCEKALNFGWYLVRKGSIVGWTSSRYFK